jgi:hypothetical protein
MAPGNSRTGGYWLTSESGTQPAKPVHDRMVTPRAVDQRIVRIHTFVRLTGVAVSPTVTFERRSWYLRTGV